MRKFFWTLTLALVFLPFLLPIRADHFPPTYDMMKNGGRLKGVLTRSNFQDSIKSLYQHLQLEREGLRYEVFNLGMIGYLNLRHEGRLNDKNILTVIDFTKPSTEKRFYTIDLGTLSLKYHTYVAHGKNTGQNTAQKFSNIRHSNQSSLGFYVTGETYVGSKGYSLRLDGAEGKYNSNLRIRGVVIHAAPYVSEDWIERYGRLGRSQGCPALPVALSRNIIDTIKDGTAIFAYYNDDEYLNASACLDLKNLMNHLEATEGLALAE